MKRATVKLCSWIFPLLLTAVAGCGSSPSKATHRYWKELKRIDSEISSAVKDMSNGDPVQSPQKVCAKIRATAGIYDQASREISVLPVSNVDTEAVEYAAEAVVLANESSVALSAIADVVEESLALSQHANSFEAGAESFIRAFLGDPLGKHYELNASATQVDTRRRQLLARWEAVLGRWGELAGREMLLRATLSQRYGGEFVPLISERGPEASQKTDSQRSPRSGHPIALVLGFIYDTFGVIGVLVALAVLILVWIGASQSGTVNK